MPWWQSSALSKTGTLGVEWGREVKKKSMNKRYEGWIYYNRIAKDGITVNGCVNWRTRYVLFHACFSLILFHAFARSLCSTAVPPLCGRFSPFQPPLERTGAKGAELSIFRFRGERARQNNTVRKKKKKREVERK